MIGEWVVKEADDTIDLINAIRVRNPRVGGAIKPKPFMPPSNIGSHYLGGTIIAKELAPAIKVAPKKLFGQTLKSGLSKAKGPLGIVALLALQAGIMAGLEEEKPQITIPKNDPAPVPKPESDGTILGLSQPQLIGGVAGGGLGAYIAPQLLPDMNETDARILGGIGGSLGGAIVGSMLNASE